MPEEIENPEQELPPSFTEFEVEGVGTVIAPEGEPGYRVRLLPNAAGIRQVTAYPALSGDPSEANAAADIAHALANPVTIAPRWRVLKDTLWMRAKAAEKQAEAVAFISSLPLSQRLDWDSQSWFWSDNMAIRAVCVEMGLDPDVALARDPLFP